MQYGAIPTSMAERFAMAAGLVPIPMLDTLFGMLKARFIMAGVRLGLFEALAQEPRSAGSLAAALRLDEDCLDLLLRTLVYCGYLAMDGERFTLSALGRKTMVSGAPKEMTGFVQWNYTQWEFAGHLEALIQTGKGVEFHESLKDPDAWGHYQQAMLETARFDAPIVARHVPVREGATRLLDIGGSHGLTGAAICRKHPPMRSTVIDLAAAIPHATALARREGIADIVEHKKGDLRRDEFGEGFDVALLANILHHFKPDEMIAVLRRVRAALGPNATVAIWELERPGRGAAPGEGDGVALFFRLTSTAGAYSGDEYAGWLKEAGFVRTKIVRPRLSPGNVLVLARTVQ
jgi:2-polyprenyl-3-methyl-5-hydroxy-6-metoxy-1,4-benzoquinol methylase